MTETKETTTGNGAKMREALEAFVRAYEIDDELANIEETSIAYHKALEALAAPPRNCDRFNTLEDALAGWREVGPDESGPFDSWLFTKAKGEVE